MRFSYTIAEYRCTKCSNTHSEQGINISIPYVFLAFLGTLALSMVFLRAPWNFPWYYVFHIFAGEFFLLFIAAIPLRLFMAIFMAQGSGPVIRRCPACGANMTFRGRHITASQTPSRIDYILLCLFVAINITLWLTLRHWAEHV